MIVTAAHLHVAFTRLRRTPRTWLVMGAWVALAVAAAVRSRAAGTVHGADRVLLDTFAAYVLPLLAYVVVGGVLGARSLAASASSLSTLGTTAARAAAGFLFVSVVVCMAFGAALASAVAILAHGAFDPPAAHDALASAYAGALGGAAYASWLSLGSSFGRTGGGRPVLLVLDALLGSGNGVTAVFAPRAHLRNLLGGSPPLELPERASAALLVALAVVCAGLAIRRAAAARG